MRRVATALAAALVLCTCASGPPAPAPGRSAAWGYVRLVPREGVTPGSSGGAYGDRRLRDVRYVDYSRPGFAVVYAPGVARDGARQRIEIRDGVAGAGLEPDHVALAAGGALEVTNATADTHVLSSPGTGVVRRLAPGETVELALREPGRHDLFLLDRADVAATAFAAPGPFVVVSSTGRFELGDLEPGPTELHVWHPRFPPANRPVDLVPGVATRVDLEVGVDRMPLEEDAP